MDVRKAGAPKDYTAIAKQYAEAVVRGDIAGAKWVRLACQRQLDDLKRFKRKDSPYRIPVDGSARTRLLPHICIRFGDAYIWRSRSFLGWCGYARMCKS